MDANIILKAGRAALVNYHYYVDWVPNLAEDPRLLASPEWVRKIKLWSARVRHAENALARVSDEDYAVLDFIYVKREYDAVGKMSEMLGCTREDVEKLERRALISFCKYYFM